MLKLNNLEIIVEELNEIENEELRKDLLELIAEYKNIKQKNLLHQKEIDNNKLLSQISRYA